MEELEYVPFSGAALAAAVLALAAAAGAAVLALVVAVRLLLLTDKRIHMWIPYKYQYRVSSIFAFCGLLTLACLLAVYTCRAVLFSMLCFILGEMP